MRHDIRVGDEARTISCPYCARRYRLPESLIGPGGARIRCPGCSGVFQLRIERAEPATSSAADPGQPTDAARAERPQSDPDRIADQVVATLEIETGTQLTEAHARGRLFAEFGPHLLGAFDVYRRLAGPAADATVFRQALHQRCGLDLTGEQGAKVPSG